MYFKIEKKLLDYGGGIYTAVLYITGVDNATPNNRVQSLLQEIVKDLHEDMISFDNTQESTRFLPYSSAMKEAGIPSKYPSSVEALYKRVKSKGELPSISPVVDLANFISLKYCVPVGVHDADSLSDDLIVRRAVEADCEITENDLPGDPLKPGEIVYVSQNNVRTRRWMWRQTSSGRVGPSATRFIIPIDGFMANRHLVDAACDELSMKAAELLGATVETGIISKDSSEFMFGTLTDEEKEIEDQIALMLKGVAQHTDISEIRERFKAAKNANRPLRVKLGLDPSAPDIHIGHSVVLRKIRQLQNMGHTAVIIIGDYTGMIGDPTGKSKTRKQLTPEQVKENAETYMEQIFKIIDRNHTEVLYNSEWLSKMTFGDVIELASKCTVARMLERDDFNNRYTNHLPLSVHEFFYPLMQAYDSVAIQADIELGGTDQTFNILMGRNIQRDYGQLPQLTLFMPLLEGTDGVEKMSKSLGNYIGVSEEPSVIYEKVMSIPDFLIIKYYNLCTDVPPDIIKGIQARLDGGENPRDIKMELAYEITQLYHGTEAADHAQERFKSVFQKNEVPDDVRVIEISGRSSSDFDQVATALVEIGAMKSKSELRRIIQQGGAKVNDQKVDSIDSFVCSDGAVLRLGKKAIFKISKKQ